MAEADKIRIEPLTVSNYPTWSVRMKMLLMFKDLWEGIEPGTDKKKSELTKALIGLNVSPEYALTVEDQPDAKTAWEYFRNLIKGLSSDIDHLKTIGLRRCSELPLVISSLKC
jgi:hypothetical protein